VIKIDYNQTNYEELLRHIGKTLKLKVTDHSIQLPAEIGSGIIRELSLYNGLQILIYNYIPSDSILFQRKKGKKEFFALRFDDVCPVQQPGNSKASVFLGSSRYDWMYLANKDFLIKSINILFSNEWLDNFLSYDEAGDTIKKYISLTMGSYIYEPMDAEYKRLMSEVLEIDEEDRRFEKVIIQNRVMIMMERFFTRLFKKTNDVHFDVKLSNDDIGRLKAVEVELIKDFALPPPQINQLARMAAMSPSKLKSSFKKIFGLPVYQYYQKHRMNKAKAMLLSKRYTVREVGQEVGFTNLSNFAKAFKKSFDQLPTDLVDNQLSY
jgi:AraC-like DNA-binding protein